MIKQARSEREIQNSTTYLFIDTGTLVIFDFIIREYFNGLSNISHANL